MFLKPSSFQKVYRFPMLFFHSPGISLNGLTVLSENCTSLTVGTLWLWHALPKTCPSSMVMVRTRGAFTTTHLRAITKPLSCTKSKLHSAHLLLLCVRPYSIILRDSLQSWLGSLFLYTSPQCSNQG